MLESRSSLLPPAAVGRDRDAPIASPHPGGAESPAPTPAFAARVLLAFIRLYQRGLSPVLPAIFGPACGCRFAPTCSHYAAEAVRVHGAGRGAWLALRRLIKCTPLHPGGIDPVPPRSARRCIAVRKDRDAPWTGRPRNFPAT